MEPIDIALILIVTIIAILICGTCIAKSHATNSQHQRQRTLYRLNTIMPLSAEEERESSHKTSESEPRQIVISCL